MKEKNLKSINPDAGDHPITSDPLEMKAIEESTHEYYSNWAYLIWRFGERGKNFTMSDGSWLAKLAHEDEALVMEQLSWLHKILANRGMPHIIIESFLDIYFKKLGNDDFKTLKNILNTWKDSRENFLKNTENNSIINGIDSALESLPLGLRPEFKNLLIAALIDESKGVAPVYNDILTWISENIVFSSKWASDLRG